MKLHVGCEFRYTFPQATPTILMLNIHYSRASDLTSPDYVTTSVSRRPPGFAGEASEV